MSQRGRAEVRDWVIDALHDKIRFGANIARQGRQRLMDQQFNNGGDKPPVIG